MEKMERKVSDFSQNDEPSSHILLKPDYFNCLNDLSLTNFTTLHNGLYQEINWMVMTKNNLNT